MKKIKVVAGLFLFTCILSLANVKADSYTTFVGIKIPAMQNKYTSDAVTKTTISDQYVKKIGGS